MADILGYIRNIKTNGWIPQNYHDTLGNGTQYAQDVNVVANADLTAANAARTVGTKVQPVQEIGPDGYPRLSLYRPPTPIAYRTAVAAADVETALGTITATKIAGAGLTAGDYYFKVVAINDYGRTLPIASNPTHVVTETTNLRVNLAWAPVAGYGHYGIYATTATDPLWSKRITAAQHAAGVLLSTLGAGSAINSADVDVIGTGLAASVNNAVNFAYKMPADAPIVCSGYQYCDFYADFSRTGDAVTPALTLAPFLYNSLTQKWGQGQLYSHSFGGPTGLYNSNQPIVRCELRGAPLVHCLVAAIAGTGAAVTLTAVLS